MAVELPSQSHVGLLVYHRLPKGCKKSLSQRGGCVYGVYIAGGAVCMECVTRSDGWLDVSMRRTLARVISPVADFVPKFAVGAPAHALPTVLALFPAYLGYG